MLATSVYICSSKDPYRPINGSACTFLVIILNHFAVVNKPFLQFSIVQRGRGSNLDSSFYGKISVANVWPGLKAFKICMFLRTNVAKA